MASSKQDLYNFCAFSSTTLYCQIRDTTPIALSLVHATDMLPVLKNKRNFVSEAMIE
jgi:hypothetical protein